MKRTEKLIISSLLIVLVGGGLLLWLFMRHGSLSVLPAHDSDSVSTLSVQDTVVVDTAKDIAVIKAYYKYLVEDTTYYEVEEYDRKSHQFLTQTLMDKLLWYDDSDYLPLYPLNDLKGLSAMKIRYLGNG